MGLQEELAYYKANEMDVQHVSQQGANTHADSQEEVQVLKQQLAAAVAELTAVRSQTPPGEQPTDNQEHHDHEVQTLRDELAAAFQEIDRCQVEGVPGDDAEIRAEFGAALQELDAYQSN